MQRHWLASYGTRIPAEINPNAYGSVLEMLEGAMARYADRPAFRCFGQTLTYADTNRLSRAFAADLQNRLGIKKGALYAAMMVTSSCSQARANLRA
jgi:long-chain acyl-CoA synthetase